PRTWNEVRAAGVFAGLGSNGDGAPSRLAPPPVLRSLGQVPQFKVAGSPADPPPCPHAGAVGSRARVLGARARLLLRAAAVVVAEAPGAAGARGRGLHRIAAGDRRKIRVVHLPLALCSGSRSDTTIRHALLTALVACRDRESHRDHDC